MVVVTAPADLTENMKALVACMFRPRKPEPGLTAEPDENDVVWIKRRDGSPVAGMPFATYEALMAQGKHK